MAWHLWKDSHVKGKQQEKSRSKNTQVKIWFIDLEDINIKSHKKDVQTDIIAKFVIKITLLIVLIFMASA